MAIPPHHLISRLNLTKAKISSGEPATGIFVLSCSRLVTEMCGTLPIDWVLIDVEAAPLGRPDTFALIQSLSGTHVTPFVRVQSNRHAEIEHALDAGALGILVPKVNTASQARAAADAAFFPPLGRRGVNPVRASAYFSDVVGYLERANRETMCLVQVETAEALDHAAEIAAVPGIDGLFIGPGDLAMALGQPGVVTGPAMDAACQRVIAATRANGKLAGIFAYSTELAQRYLSEGFTFVAIGNDLKLLRGAIERELAAVCQPRAAVEPAL